MGFDMVEVARVLKLREIPVQLPHPTVKSLLEVK